MATAEGFVRRLTRKLTESPEVRDAEELTDEATNTGAQRAIDCCRGQEVTMVGRLRSVETNAKLRGESGPSSSTAPTRSPWCGWASGASRYRVRTDLRVRGRLGMLDNGSKAMYNPHYEIQR